MFPASADNGRTLSSRRAHGRRRDPLPATGLSKYHVAVKRLWVAMLVVLVAGAAAAAAYLSAAQDREFRQLVATGEDALTRDDVGLAIEAFSGAIALKPDSMLAHLKRGETYRRQGDLKAAMRDLRTASALDPAATRPLEQLGDVQAATGRHDRAIERYAAYVRLDDRSARVLYKLAAAYYQAGQPHAALEPLGQAIALNAGMAEAHYLRGLCLEATGQRSAARASLQRAVTLEPGAAPAREALAAVARANGNHAEATEQLEALAALDRTRPARLIALGLGYADARRTDLAVVTLGRAAERFPDSADVYAALGDVWLRSADHTGDRVALGKALEALRTAVVRGGSGSRELALYGRALLMAGDAQGAARSLREAATKLPVDPTALLWLGRAHERLGQRREARDALQRYLALIPGEPPPGDVLRRLGELSLRLGDRTAGLEWLRRAAAASPGDGAPLARIGALDRRR